MKKQHWFIRFAADIDLGKQSVSQAHRQMMELRQDLEDAGFPTTDFRVMLAPREDVQATSGTAS